MTLGEKIARLRTLEGFARGLDRDMTQTEVAKAIRDEHGGKISQSYLSQIESGARRHLTSETRLLLARFFRVHPGHLVDDVEDLPAPRHMRPRREMDDKLDLWLIEGAETFAQDKGLSKALLAIAKHEHSRECLVLFGSIVENRHLIDHLLEKLAPEPQVRKGRRARSS